MVLHSNEREMTSAGVSMIFNLEEEALRFFSCGVFLGLFCPGAGKSVQ